MYTSKIATLVKLPVLLFSDNKSKESFLCSFYHSPVTFTRCVDTLVMQDFNAAEVLSVIVNIISPVLPNYFR